MQCPFEAEPVVVYATYSFYMERSLHNSVSSCDITISSYIYDAI